MVARLLMWMALALGLPGASLAAGPVTPQGTERPLKYLFWHLSPMEGAPPELSAQIEASLRSYFERKHGKVLMDSMTMDTVLLVEGNEMFLRCGVGEVCLAGLGEAAEIPWVITGEVILRGDHVLVRMVLVDVAGKKVEARAEIEGKAPLDEKQLEELSVGMFEPSRYRGKLVVTSPVAGAEVLVDGKPVGMTPLSPREIVAGTHRVEIRKRAHQTFVRDLRVPLGGTAEVEAILVEIEDGRRVPFHRSWSFWTFAGVTAVAGGLGIGLAVDAQTLQEKADQARDANRSDWQQWQDKADSRKLQSTIALGVGGASLIAAGVIVVLDLTSRDDDDEVTALEVAPWASGAGLTATLRF